MCDKTLDDGRPAGPTLGEIRQWPATVSVRDAAAALGVSRAAAYAALRNGTFPAKAVQVGARTVIITSSILAVLDVRGDAKVA